MIFLQKKKEIIALSKPSCKPKELLDLFLLANIFTRQLFPAHHHDRLIFILVIHVGLHLLSFDFISYRNIRSVKKSI